MVHCHLDAARGTPEAMPIGSGRVGQMTMDLQYVNSSDKPGVYSCSRLKHKDPPYKIYP